MANVMTAAKALYHKRGNRLTWQQCVTKAAKDMAKKPVKKRAAVSGKKQTVKKVVVNRKPVNIRIGTDGSALTEIVTLQRKVAAEQNRLESMQGVKLAGMSAVDKNRQRAKIKTQKAYIGALRKNMISLKKFIK